MPVLDDVDALRRSVAAALRAEAAKMPRNSQDEIARADRIMAVAALHDPANDVVR